MKIKVIHNEEAHEAALRELEQLMDSDPQPGSDAFEQMELLALVIKDYESRRYPLDPPDPIEAIKFRLEQEGLTRKDLESILGSRARVSEVLNRRRPLSLSMVRRIYQRFGIPAEILIGGLARVSPRKRTSERRLRQRVSRG